MRWFLVPCSIPGDAPSFLALRCAECANDPENARISDFGAPGDLEDNALPAGPIEFAMEPDVIDALCGIDACCSTCGFLLRASRE